MAVFMMTNPSKAMLKATLRSVFCSRPFESSRRCVEPPHASPPPKTRIAKTQCKASTSYIFAKARTTSEVPVVSPARKEKRSIFGFPKDSEQGLEPVRNDAQNYPTQGKSGRENPSFKPGIISLGNEKRYVASITAESVNSHRREYSKQR